ncbi:MAG: lysylphosphatidylglycerol synthase transmembrane domain-containing protein [Roseiflexaceae bacterium]|jgi:uncharacterized protein (TIRG00374 family)|nr:flippase-like domain-containing protein [Chloroflexaceae bacterium]
MDANNNNRSDGTTERGFSLVDNLRRPRTWVSFALAGALIWFLFRSLDVSIAETLETMKETDIKYLVLALLIFYITFPMRALRWRMLIEHTGVAPRSARQTWASLPALMEYIYLSWFVNCIVPAKLGDAYRGYLLKQNGKVSFSKTVGTVFAERLLDMLGLFTFLGISGLFLFGTHVPAEMQWLFYVGAGLVVVIVLGLLSLRWFGGTIERFVPQRLKARYAQFSATALQSFQPQLLPGLIGLTMIIWLLEGCRLYFVIVSMHSLGLSLPLPLVIFVSLASSLLTVVPFTPAGLGLVEGAVTAVLVTMVHVTRHVALAVTLLDRLINFWSIIVFGTILYVVSKRR